MNYYYAYLLVLGSFVLGYLCCAAALWMEKKYPFKKQPKKAPKRKWPSAYLIAGLLAAQAAGAQTLHLEPSLIMSSRFALGAGMAATVQWEGNLQAWAFGTYEHKRSANTGLAAGARLYTTYTDVDGWLIAGATYTWHSAAALHSGEGLRNGLRPMVGFRFDYKPAILQIEYNIEAVYLRCGITLF